MKRTKMDNSRNTSYLTFKVGTENYASDVTHVQHIMQVGKITKLPNAPEYIKGVINIRGMVLPVIDTNIKFNQGPTKVDEKTSILLIDLNYKGELLQIGAMVNEVNEVIEVADNDILPTPTLGRDTNSKIIKGIIESEKELIMILDMNKLYTEEDIIEISDQLKNVK